MLKYFMVSTPSNLYCYPCIADDKVKNLGLAYKLCLFVSDMQIFIMWAVSIVILWFRNIESKLGGGG